MPPLALTGKRVAVLAENTYEDLELWHHLIRLREAGAEVSQIPDVHPEAPLGLPKMCAFANHKGSLRPRHEMASAHPTTTLGDSAHLLTLR
jgi:hypothetical protein